jgi:hypothetical protein
MTNATRPERSTSESASRRPASPHAEAPRSSVRLHVGELVLHGVSPDDRYRVGDAFQQELTRLFTEQGVPPALRTGRETARLDGGAVRLSPAASAVEIGTRLAEAVYRGLGG